MKMYQIVLSFVCLYFTLVLLNWVLNIYLDKDFEQLVGFYKSLKLMSVICLPIFIVQLYLYNKKNKNKQ